MAHPIYKLQDIEEIKKYHHEPQGIKDKAALTLCSIFRKGMDLVSNYNPT